MCAQATTQPTSLQQVPVDPIDPISPIDVIRGRLQSVFDNLVTQATLEVESLLSDESFAAALQDFAALLPLSSGIGQNQIDTAMHSLEPLFGDLSALPASVDLGF